MKKKTTPDRKSYTGIFRSKPSYAWIEADGGAKADILVPRPLALNAENGDRVEFEITGRKFKKGAFEARVLSVFDAESAFRAEMALLPEKHGLATARHPALPEAVKAHAMADDKNVRDLREVQCFTIDPDDAKDFDDAVSLVEKGDHFELGVYIADVSYYVPENSALDREAFKRGVSVYLPWGVVPMLPPILSEDLCSLKPDEERRAVACVMRVSRDGELLSDEVFRCRIRSKRRLNYCEAQEMLDGKRSGEPGLLSTLRLMDGLSKTLKTRRLKEGSLDFDLPETKVRFGDDGLPVSVSPYPKYSTNSLIEEFMLLANRAVGMRLKKKFTKAMFRVHEEPDEEALVPVFAMIKAQGIKLGQPAGPGAFRAAIESVRGTPIEKTVHMMVLRSMPKARYNADNLGHFGLAFDTYTHFTSPIRRYPDLVVHRLLLQGTVQGKKGKKQDLRTMAESVSASEEKALKAERDGVSLASCLLLHRRIGEEFKGRLSGMIDAGLFVELGGLGVDGMIHVSKLGPGFHSFDPFTMTMSSRQTGRRFRIGDTLRVKVEKVSVALRRVDLALLE